MKQIFFPPIKTDAPPVILAIESSADSVSAAIFRNGQIASLSVHNARYGHAETLAHLVEQTIADAELGFDDFTHIAANCGPGSFTGLRICLSAAKGYIIATGAKALGVNGLIALNYYRFLHAQDRATEYHYIALCDTRRKSVFLQISDKDGLPIGSIQEIELSQLDTFLSRYISEHKTALILSGYQSFEPYLTDSLADDLVITTPIELRADVIACYAAASLNSDIPNSDRLPITALEAIYVTPPKLGSKDKQIS